MYDIHHDSWYTRLLSLPTEFILRSRLTVDIVTNSKVLCIQRGAYNNIQYNNLLRKNHLSLQQTTFNS